MDYSRILIAYFNSMNTLPVYVAIAQLKLNSNPELLFCRMFVGSMRR